MRPLAAILLLLAPASAPARDEPPKPESNYVKLLKKAPEARLGTIVDILGQRGDADDLAYLFGRAVDPKGFPPAVRLKALEVLADAALTRKAVPGGDVSGLARLFGPAEPAARLAAFRLAGVWKAEATVPALAEIARARGGDDSARSSALDAMAAIGGAGARGAIEALSAADQPLKVRTPAVAALARIDVDAAADRAPGVLVDDADIRAVTPLIAAFLDRQGGAEKLADALGRRKPTPDGARLALRAVYALGRADESLVGSLSKLAGIEAEAGPPTRAEVESLIADVAVKGDAAKGELIFRRAEMNCMKCHALSGASGGVGPELSALGLSSPVDYVIDSILIPDQSIKEEFQTRVVLTDDGRVLQGIVVDEDDKRLVLKDATSELRTIPTVSIEDSKKGGSLMPKGLAKLLTRAEFVDLVRFLSELGKPGPYAIKPVPTIQRWRVLKATPEGLARGVPDAEALRSQVLDAEAELWVAAYSLVGGGLPIPDLVEATGGRVAYAQGEINVSSAGPVAFRFQSARGLAAWLDDRPLAIGDPAGAEVGEGKHKLTIRVDAAERGNEPVRVEVARPEASSAEFSVVGGR